MDTMLLDLSWTQNLREQRAPKGAKEYRHNVGFGGRQVWCSLLAG